MIDDMEWFMDWRVWGIVLILGGLSSKYMYGVLLESFLLPKWKAILLLAISFPVSYIPGKIIIDKE